MPVFTARIHNFDIEKSRVILELNYLDQKLIGDLLGTIDKENEVKVRIQDLGTKQSSNYNQQKLWYASITTILKSEKFRTPITKESIGAMDLRCREEFFPVRMVAISDQMIPVIPQSMKELSFEEMFEANQNLIEKYTKLGVNF